MLEVMKIVVTGLFLVVWSAHNVSLMSLGEQLENDFEDEGMMSIIVIAALFPSFLPIVIPKIFYIDPAVWTGARI